MSQTAVLLLQAVCFEAEGNKMKAGSGAMIKVRALCLAMLVATLAKKEHFLCCCQRWDMQVVHCKPQLELQTAPVPLTAEADTREVHI